MKIPVEPVCIIFRSDCKVYGYPENLNYILFKYKKKSQCHVEIVKFYIVVKSENHRTVWCLILHITAACEQLAPTVYVKRHDGLAKITHQKLAEAAEMIDDKSPYYKCTPASVPENENFKLYWNGSILTDKTVPFNTFAPSYINTQGR